MLSDLTQWALIRQSLWIQYQMHEQLTANLDAMQRHYQRRLEKNNLKACRALRFAMQDHSHLRTQVAETIGRLEHALVKLDTITAIATHDYNHATTERN